MKNYISTISDKYPTFRDIPVKSVYKWLEGKCIDDGAEDLWRIHDSIYDLTDFIDHHPGGSDWLKLTKGTDITEAFESHHITLKPENILPKYKVRNAKEPRHLKFTFDDNGFYRTLKSRVREKLQTIDYSPENRTKIIQDILLVTTFSLCIFTSFFESYILGIFSGLFLTWTAISAHNYFHKRDNWRMYPFNLTLMSYKDWRVSHALSHHLFTNSFYDLELSMFEPFFCYLPNPNCKNFIQRYISWIYGPIIYSVLYFMEFFKKFYLSFMNKRSYLFKEDLIPFSLPLLMFIFGNHDVIIVMKMWIFIIVIGSFMFSLIGLNAAHHHPEIVHDGDSIRDGLDWGIYQMDAVMDRNDISGSQFLVQTHFGEHTLHHLFPTLDHGILPQLYEILTNTCEEFETEFRHCSWLQHIIGQHKQLARIKANPNPRIVKKNK